jgi:hypothetical protein
MASNQAGFRLVVAIEKLVVPYAVWYINDVGHEKTTYVGYTISCLLEGNEYLKDPVFLGSRTTEHDASFLYNIIVGKAFCCLVVRMTCIR